MYSTAILFTVVAVGLVGGQHWVALSDWRPTRLDDGPDASPAPRHSAAVWCVEDDLYVLGGAIDVRGIDTLSDFWKYESETRRWLWLPPTPFTTGRSSAAHWQSKDSLWLYGGRPKDDVNGGLLDMWRYDGRSIGWHRLAENTALPNPGRIWGAVHWYDARSNRLYLFGGGCGDTAVSGHTIMWSMNGARELWEPIEATRMPPPRVSATWTEVANNHIVMYGGQGVDGGALYDLWLWSDDQWSQLSNGTRGDAPNGINAVSWIDGSGRYAVHEADSIWLYSFDSHQWTRNSPITTTIPLPQSTVCGHYYAFGGIDGAQRTTNAIWRYVNNRDLILHYTQDVTPSILAAIASWLILAILLGGITVVVIVKLVRWCKNKSAERKIDRLSEELSLATPR